ncbi:MAG: hypothetical protein OXE99_13990 [Cellvibrionales bacterium]|nr:hypothetical protein [Cellvibrionales bacterium]
MMKDTYNPEQLADFEHTADNEFSLPAGVVAGIEITLLTVVSIAIHYLINGTTNLLFILLSLFLSINLLICLWEICLYLRRDYIEKRHDYFKKRREITGRDPGVDILLAPVTRKSVFSPTFWSDIWSTYSLYDGSYADRKTYGFTIDTGNGFATFIPSLILHFGMTVPVFPPMFIGILGIMMFWQWTYCTSLYWASFFIAGRHKLISKKDMFVYIWGTNAPWVMFSILGLYASVRIVLDNSYAVFLN